MQEIESYKLIWSLAANEGRMMYLLVGGGTAIHNLDSPQEGQLIIDMLRNEKPVYYDAENDLIMTGMEAVGEGEAAAD